MREDGSKEAEFERDLGHPTLAAIHAFSQTTSTDGQFSTTDSAQQRCDGDVSCCMMTRSGGTAVPERIGKDLPRKSERICPNGGAHKGRECCFTLLHQGRGLCQPKTLTTICFAK